MQETQVPSLGWEDPLEKRIATHSGILAWRIPWTEEPGGGGLQSLGLQLDTTEQACVKHHHMLRTSCLEGDSFVMVYLMQPVYVANCTCQVVCWAHRGMGADTAPALMIPVV